MIDRKHELSLSRQSQILGLCRAGLYYEAVPISGRGMELMRLIDEIHMKYPFYGVRRVRNELLYQKPRLSTRHPKHKIYPYLLRGLEITRANHVWAADITYLPMAKGFCYLVAVMDWASRKVLAWRLSNTLDTSFCTEALEEAITKYGKPEIFNTDQGSQFTSDDFTDVLKTNGIDISMDGKGQWTDDVFVERLWRSVKYEDVYLKAYSSVAEARRGLAAYFEFYNQRRRHQGLDYRTPDEVYLTTLPDRLVAA